MPRPLLNDRVAALRARRVADDRIRVRRTVARRDGMRCEVLDEHGAGKWLLNFCSNDYLGLSQQFAVTGALQDMAAREGTGGFASHLIATATIAIPSMILGETTLSFLGLGLRAPITSWGVLLTEAQNINAVALYPWLLWPVLPVILVVLAFNFLGDGLRDAADPYK